MHKALSKFGEELIQEIKPENVPIKPHYNKMKVWAP